jgi:hypothetical protein
MQSRRGRDKDGHVDPFYARRRRYEVVFKTLGLSDSFSRVPRGIQEVFLKRKFPDPVLEYAPAFPADRALRKQLDFAFRQAAINVNGTSLTVRDFLSIVVGLRKATEGIEDEQGLPADVTQFFHAACPSLIRCYDEHLLPALTSLFISLDTILIAKTRLDTQLLFAIPNFRQCLTGKVGVQITADAVQPKMQRVTLEDSSRPVYRVAKAGTGTGVRWLSWDKNRLDHRCLRDEHPVYVQSHALKQLQQRINLPDAKPYLEHWLNESLNEPYIVDRQGDDLLIEYRLKEYRVGYLVVTMLDEMAVVRTFKFLTMEGSPEARMLHQRLGLTRRDVDWLRLSELSAFTQTDLRQDEELRSIFEECGCGHLFSPDLADCVPSSQSYAADLRRYLRMAA